MKASTRQHFARKYVLELLDTEVLSLETPDVVLPEPTRQSKAPATFGQ